MKRRISFGSIGQYRTAVSSVKNIVRYAGNDASSEPIFNSNKLPIITVTATEKIHGSNGAVSYSIPDGFWVHSRKNILSKEEDNYGCAFYCENNKDEWLDIIHALADEYSIDLNENILSVFFEWSGSGIQKNSACSGLDKRAIIFQHFKVSPLEPQTDDSDPNKEKGIWYETYINDNTTRSWVENPDVNIFNICATTLWEFEIDFEKPEMSVNSMIKRVVEDIEPKSPYGAFHGMPDNIGEGMVVTFRLNEELIRFKVKGEKHAKSKIKKLKPVDDVKEQKKIDYVNLVVTPSRLEQAWDETFKVGTENLTPDIKMTGDFIRAVMKDVMKEENDILMSMSLEPKDVNSKISMQSRNWFMGQLDKIAFE